ncbi:hypothetical protein EI975_21190 [Bacillus licheniformis]|uniref:hypothetical protein n=1 Tax=Bacillus subtilis group TaxID=653685 RepID=UPI0011ED51DD|nr:MULTISPECIES: hypothetical protein [Bacillus subtilis group]KAA0817053.1 hypothetical protein EI974_09425 [Bacillus licheniformis]KAA0829952.1 hypothetical protein EI980_16410 [Bacillus licheniformis]KAA0835308.1 hypothetical protein EI979_20510 [Bacillus paralicheniformis]KAA0844464.1 hypothetical protein EI975_21190 [Bacillus licheniformis]
MPKEVGQDFKKSTWREQVVSLAFDDVTTVYFDDTKPNHASITNMATTILYVGLSPNVSKDNFLLIVSPGQTKVFARELGYHTLYLKASSGGEKIRIESWEGKFSASSIPQSLDVVQIGEMSGQVDVTSLPPLPKGTNNIGKVTIDGGATLVGSSIPDTEPVPIREAGMNNFRTGAVMVGVTSVPAMSGSSPLPNRREITVYPPETGVIYWGKPGVTTGTGAPLTSNDSPITFKVHDLSPDIHLVSDNEVKIHVVEVA